MRVTLSFYQKALRSVTTISALALAATMSAGAAPVTFGQFIQLNGAEQQWSVSTTAMTTTVTASGEVYFSFSGVSGLPFSGPQRALFALSATSTQLGNCGVACGPGDSFVQPGYSGTFSFISEDINPGANLLSGTFAIIGDPSTTGAQFSSSIGSSGGSFNSSATAGNLDQLVLTSAYLSFMNVSQANASWSLSSLIPKFFTGAVASRQALPGDLFNAAGSGTFSADGAQATPEPATFGLMGCTLLGLRVMLRRRS